MKIMFINCVDYHRYIETVYTPLGLGYLASSLRSHFGKQYFKFKIINRNIEQELDIFKPDVVGITSVTQNFNKAINYAKIVKKRDIPVIVGGVHITTLPQTLTDDMDVGIISEGEQTIIELFELFEKKGEFDKDNLKAIDGVVYKKNGKHCLTKERELITPLDKIPFPARDLMEIGKAAYMFSSRGCPYRCTFCSSSRFWEKVRFFSPEYVINDIKELINTYNVKSINFWDDMFIVNRNRFEKIAALIKEEGINKKVKFGVQCRSDSIDQYTVKLLKEINVKSVGMGLESGCERTLRYLKGNSVTIEDNKNAITLLKKNGISANGSFIIGSPTETKEEIMETLEFIKKTEPSSFDILLLTPYPGTPIWNYAKEKGLVSDNMDWDILNVEFSIVHKKAIILSETLTRDELYDLFLMFQQERKRRIRSALIKSGLKKPYKIPNFLLKKIKEKLGIIPEKKWEEAG